MFGGSRLEVATLKIWAASHTPRQVLAVLRGREIGPEPESEESCGGDDSNRPTKNKQLKYGTYGVPGGMWSSYRVGGRGVDNSHITI